MNSSARFGCIALIALCGCATDDGATSPGIITQRDLDQSAIEAAGRNDRRSFDIARRLGANIHARDRHGNNTVLAAVQARDRVLLRELLLEGVDANAQGGTGFTPLTYAAMTGSASTVRLLLAHGARPDQRNVLGATPLHTAAEFGRSEIIGLLLGAGARIDARNAFGETPLVSAVAAERIESLKALIDAGADVDVVDRNDHSALMMSLLQDSEPMALMLAQAGASFHARPRQYSPLRLARGLGYTRVVAALESRGARE